jgi:hypothetical protein
MKEGDIMNKYEYSFVPDNVDIYLRDEAIDFGVVYAHNIEEAKSLAWKSIPYDYTVLSVRKVG